MYTRIKEFVQSCIECQRKKGINRKEYNEITPLKHPSYPFERMSMDLVGPLTETKKGNKYILTIMDYFSRWPEAIPIKNAEAATVGQAYLASCYNSFRLSTYYFDRQWITVYFSSFRLH